jgi:hypothetical protein
MGQPYTSRCPAQQLFSPATIKKLLDARKRRWQGRAMFKRWYKSQGFRTQQECADYLNLHKSTVSRMLKDENYRPDRVTAIYIETKTGGKVPATSWRRIAA